MSQYEPAANNKQDAERHLDYLVNRVIPRLGDPPRLIQSLLREEGIPEPFPNDEFRRGLLKLLKRKRGLVYRFLFLLFGERLELTKGA